MSLPVTGTAERNRAHVATCAGITLESALVAARQTLASVTERAKQPGYYSGARTDIINAHADLRAALDLLVKATSGPSDPPRPERQNRGDPEKPQKPISTG
jgi:hypothetical protein